MIRRAILVLMVVIGVAAIGSLFVGNRPLYHRQDLKSCFNDSGGVKAGAPVRIAGVDVGTVHSVRANPQNKSCPAEVEIALSTAYEIRIPSDSITGIETEGLLGEAA